jgi:hypothetical protein
MQRCRAVLAVMSLLLMAAIGCRAAAPAPAPAAPTLPTSASVGGANIVAIAPPAQACCPKQTLPQFLGITGACEGIKGLIDRLRNHLGAIWPGLEAKPEVLAIADPANLESPNPAVQSAAAIKAEEDAAAQKAKAIAYLAGVGCAGCYPGVEEALLAALDDCTELLRFETAKALRSTAHGPCKNCCRSACCGPKIREKLEKLAYELDSQGCYVEPSDRVRRMARLALANCNCVPLKPGDAPQQTLPPEGPGPADLPPPPPATATASVLQLPSGPIGSGLAVLPEPASAARPVSYHEAIRNYGSRDAQLAPAALETTWEVWSARPADFASRQDAVTAMTLARIQLLGSQPAPLPQQLIRQAHGWTNPQAIRSPAIARAVAATPVGGVSGVIEDAAGWHLVRPTARRPAQPTPAQPGAPITAQPAAGAANTPITTVRLPPCDCR